MQILLHLLQSPLLAEEETEVGLEADRAGDSIQNVHVNNKTNKGQALEN